MHLFILLVYEIVLWFLALLAIPKTLYSMFYLKKYKESFPARFGFNYPKFDKHTQPSIWIHAVSVGETKAIVSIARELKRRYPDHPLIISSVTETGHAEAKRSLPFADYHVYLPFDFSWVVYKIVNRASPAIVVLSESDFWFNFLYYAKRKGAAIFLANGKMSPRSVRRFASIPFFSKSLFNLFDLLCVQNELYRSRFVSAGAPPGKLKVTGNLKLDEEYPQLSQEQVCEWRQKLGIQPNDLVLTIGSSHAPEEQFFLSLLQDIWKKCPFLKVILVPRRPELFKDVAQLLDKERLRWISFTEISQRVGNEHVIFINAMGMLRMCYQLSNYAIVGGSFTDRVGGHNILEPCWYGKPVLFGPHMHTQLELVELMSRYGAGLQVPHEQLKNTLQTWIDQPQIAQNIGLKGLHLISDLKGSNQRTLTAIDPYLVHISSHQK